MAGAARPLRRPRDFRDLDAWRAMEGDPRMENWTMTTVRQGAGPILALAR
jgi:hypothetical protein